MRETFKEEDVMLKHVTKKKDTSAIITVINHRWQMEQNGAVAVI